MAEYIKPPMNNLPFSFGSGGYSKPDFDNITFSFKTNWTSFLSASINVMQEDYIKDCPTYVTGYGGYSVQIIKGRCIYGGFRSLSAYINIHGEIRHLSADMLPLMREDLGSVISPIPAGELPAYLNVWPETDLPASTYGWAAKDLPASMGVFQYRDLSANIGMHRWVDLPTRIKGYVREAPYDLQGIVAGLAYANLPAQIRAKYLSDLLASVFSIVAPDLPAYLHGYQVTGLPAALGGVAWPYDLPASLVITGDLQDLPAILHSKKAVELANNLTANISSWYTRNLQALINVAAPENLPASLAVLGGSSNLAAFIYPKMIRLTTIISFVTMEARELSAVINVCGGSMFSDLSATMIINYIGDLAATITGKYAYNSTADLNTTVGYAPTYFVIDKLPLTLQISVDNYRVYDKLPLFIELSRQFSGLWASIVGEYTSTDLNATLTVEELDAYNFERSKNRQRVHFGLGSTTESLSYETVELSFTNLVSDYFFNSAEAKVYKTDPLERWVTSIESFIPADKSLGIKRRLHKDAVLHDIEKFATVDEAVRFLMDYVTSYPQESLGATIASKGQFSTLGAQLTAI